MTVRTLERPSYGVGSRIVPGHGAPMHAALLVVAALAAIPADHVLVYDRKVPCGLARPRWLDFWRGWRHFLTL